MNQRKRARVAGPLFALVALGWTDAAPAAEPPDPAQVAELLAALRAGKVDGGLVWGAAVRELVGLGPGVTPTLVAELDKTRENVPMRLLAFAARAVGDPRAVPALIRAIPRTLVPAGSDFGLDLADPDLLAFLQEHDLDENRGGPHYTLGMPFREVTGALRKLTGKRFNEDELNFVNLSGGPHERQLQARYFHRLAETWAAWWEQEHGRFTKDEAYAKVNLPPLPELPKAADAAQPFPVGPGVKASTAWGNVIVGPPQDLKYYKTFHDLDTGRQLPWPEALPAPGAARAEAVAAWAGAEGYDLRGVEYRPPGADRSYYAIETLGMRAWMIDNPRFETIEKELQSGRAPELGTPAGQFLMDYDPETKTYYPENKATFLFVTREGATGVLQLNGIVNELFTKEDFGKPTRPGDLKGFYRGVQFQYKLIGGGTD